MPYDPSIFNINPYYDDYDGDKGFLRVLFKPGYAVQARELTQLQTILQNQFSKIGDHLFKDGSRIVGGGISVRNSSYMMLSVDGTSPLRGIDDYSFLVGGELTNNSTVSPVRAKIVHYLTPDTTDGSLIVVLDFLSGSEFGQNGGMVFVKDDLLIEGINVVSGVEYPVEGACKLVTVSNGIFYVDGFFVRVDTSSFSPYRTLSTYRDLSFDGFSSLTKRVGFSVLRDTVTDDEDGTLKDPAIGSYNHNAPGADRYRINLVLSQTELEEDKTDFLELLRLEKGKITRKIDRISYGEIQKVLARRTFDESGSYTVKAFDIVPKELDASSLSLSIGKGKAYVLGYEVENQYPTSVILSKARTIQSQPTTTYQYTTGNYIDATMNVGTLGATFSTNLLTIGAGSARVVYRGSTGSVVAEGYVHGAIPRPPVGSSGSSYRLYNYGISGSLSGASSGYLYQHGTGATIGEMISVSGGLQFSFASSLVFEIKPGQAINNLNSLVVPTKAIGDSLPSTAVQVSTSGFNTSYTFTKNHFSSTIATSNASVFDFFPYGEPGYNSVDVSDITFVRGSDGAAYTPSAGTISNVNNEVTITVSNALSGFTAGVIRAVAPILYRPDLSDSSTFRTKTSTDTLVSAISSSTPLTDENGRKYFRIPLYDVYKVSSVTYTTGTPATVVDVTDDFELDDGQRETHYDFARLYIKKERVSLARYTTATQTVLLNVSCSYFVHGGLACAPFIGKHSYVNIDYQNIPLYTDSKSGKTVSLANCLDFRKTGITASVPMLKPYGRTQFGIAGDTQISYDYYLPRMDKLCVKADPEDGSALFYLVGGVPDVAPVAPPDPTDGLVLAILTLPAYTHDNTSVVVTPIDSKRYTMEEIGKLDKRMDEMEVFAKLSLSETELESRSLKRAAAATEPLKTSILVDEFYGHSVADVVDRDFSCSIDFERGEMRPFFETVKISTPEPQYTNSVVSEDGLVTLAYEEINYITNNQYSTTVAVNPSNAINWLGYMTLSPAVDAFYDSSYRPIVKTNALKENDNWLSSNPNNARGFGTQWNDWESIWTGIEEVQEEQDDIQKRIVDLPRTVSDSAVPSINSGNNRIGISRTVDSTNEKTSNYIRVRRLKNRIKQKIGSRVVDRSVVPYIPSKTVTATVHGLKPNTGSLILSFDGEVVSTGISTDQYGSCTVEFTIPAGKYLVGERIVRISDSEQTENSTMSAEATYYCTGLLDQRSDGVVSTRPPELRRLLPESEAVSKDPFNREIDSVENTHWSDPLSQTFFVDKKTNPNGIFLSSVTLYFAEKNTTIPVVVQIRPTVSGYPSPSVVVPFSTVIKPAADVQANASSPTETVFTFSSPVYLEPGEYAICVLANSNNYRLFAAQSGTNTVNNNAAVAARAGSNQKVGTLYVPQGIGPAAEVNSTDLMFSANRCEFTPSGTIRWSAITSLANKQVIKVYSSEVIPNTCLVSRSLDSIGFSNNETLYPTRPITPSPNMEYELLRGSDTAVSPVIDVATLLVAGIRMNASSPETAVARYVSRVIELPSELASNGIAVFVDAALPVPSNSNIRAYYRAVSSGEADVFSRQWIPMTRTTSVFTSTSEIDFREVEFRGETTDMNQKFSAYQIAVELESPSTTSTYNTTPSARNIRAVSYIRV